MLPARIHRRSPRLFVIVLSLLATAALAAPVAAQGPAGNNGTVKIDRLDFDQHPNNEPHVGCTFEVDFYGFDQGDQWADVTFEAHPPTGHGELVHDTLFIGDDDNAGGGSEAGWDASREYDLTAALAAFDAHPNQGYHVKLTVNADGSQGADTKHKVYWVGPCSTPPTNPPGGGGGTQTPPGDGTLGGNPGVGTLPDTSTGAAPGSLLLLVGTLLAAGSLLRALQLRRVLRARRT